MPINAADYILPLVVGKKDSSNVSAGINRFAGTGFFIGVGGLVATCSHIMAPLENNEMLMAYSIHQKKFFELKSIHCHAYMDFAIARIDVKDNKFLKLLSTKERPLVLGTNVSSFGYINAGRVGFDLRLEDKYFKGYISFIGNKPDASMRCRTVCELSFPSLTGFSGAPVFLGDKSVLAGMLFGNRETNIEVFSRSAVEAKAKPSRNSIFRTMEFGLMHTIDDIKSFLVDIGMNVEEL